MNNSFLVKLIDLLKKLPDSVVKKILQSVRRGKCEKCPYYITNAECSVKSF